MMFKSLDFLYVPAPDIESSVQYYTQVLGGQLLWKIHAYGVWVACIELSKVDKPHILLADHIHKNDVMLIYQVEKIMSDLFALFFLRVLRLLWMFVFLLFSVSVN
jgi:hypothetical protein